MAKMKMITGDLHRLLTKLEEEGPTLMSQDLTQIMDETTLPNQEGPLDLEVCIQLLLFFPTLLMQTFLINKLSYKILTQPPKRH